MGVKLGDRVRVRYRGTLVDGSEFDSSEGRAPLEFLVGEGKVIPGFEEAVVGLESGDSVTVTIPPQKAYGHRIEEAVQSVEPDAFLEPPHPGDIVRILSATGDELTATVTSADEAGVVLDFNHPLAGETLVFSIEVVQIETA